MKKNIVLSLIILFSTSAIFSQTCVDCDATSSASGTYSTALGNSTTASGNASFAAGANSIASGSASFALGLWNISDDSYATTFGSYSHASGNKSMVIGHGYGSNFYLTNSISYSLAINSDVPTMFIGTSSGPGFTGKIGIGNITTPEFKLHLLSDEGEEAAIFIEPRNWLDGESSSLILGSIESGITANAMSGMNFLSEGNYFFNSGGFVGINTTKPEYNLHVNGSLFATAFRLYDPHLPPKEGNILISDNLGNAYWADASDFGLWKLAENHTDIYRSGGKHRYC